MNDILIKYDYSWSIIRTKHNAKVRSVSNLSKIDKIICGIINNTENKEIHFEDLGLILGLGTRDILEYSDDVKFYKDSSEINILKGFIKECSKYHLVEMEKESSIIKLTEWGIHALNHGEKYQYHDCTLSSYKHVNFKLKDNENSYPFFELDLTVDIVEKETLKKIYDFPEEKNDLTKELIYQLSNSKQKGKYIIDGVDDKSLIGKTLTHKKVDVCLGADEQSLTFEYEGTELPEISSSISLLENNILQTYLQRKGIYLHFTWDVD